MTEQTQDPRPVLFPFLRYADARAAVGWLCDAFGFEKLDVFDGADGTVAHAELRLGTGVIMLGQARGDALGVRTPRELGWVTGGIYAYVADPDAHCARARAAGAQVVLELADMSYGSREYSCHDLEGNLWSFGTYRP